MWGPTPSSGYVIRQTRLPTWAQTHLCFVLTMLARLGRTTQPTGHTLVNQTRKCRCFPLPSFCLLFYLPLTQALYCPHVMLFWLFQYYFFAGGGHIYFTTDGGGTINHVDSQYELRDAIIHPTDVNTILASSFSKCCWQGSTCSSSCTAEVLVPSLSFADYPVNRVSRQWLHVDSRCWLFCHGLLYLRLE